MILPILSIALCAFAVPANSEPVEEASSVTAEASVEELSSETVIEVSSEETAAAETESYDFGQWLKETFSPEVVAAIVSAITAVASLLKMASVLKNLAKDKGKSAEDIYQLVLQAIKSESKEDFEANVKPLVDQIYGFKDLLAEMMKVFALMQENTPEARVAILDILSKLGNEQVATLSDDAKKAIADEIASIEAKKQETLEKVEKATEEAKAAYDGTSI